MIERRHIQPSSPEHQPAAWTLQETDPTVQGYLAALDRNGSLDSIMIGRALKSITQQLEPGTGITIMGRAAPSEAHLGRAMLAHFNHITNAATHRNPIPQVDHLLRAPGMLVAFPGLPAPNDITTFLDQHSQSRDPMAGWSANGELPYIALTHDMPGKAAYGFFNPQTRTQQATGWNYPTY